MQTENLAQEEMTAFLEGRWNYIPSFSPAKRNPFLCLFGAIPLKAQLTSLPGAGRPE